MSSEANRHHYNRRTWKDCRPGTLRWEVFSRDAWRCRMCARISKHRGGDAVLTLHHINPRGGAVKSNLLTLCRRCHGKLDGPRARRRTKR